jgi:hypothetical protein
MKKQVKNKGQKKTSGQNKIVQHGPGQNKGHARIKLHHMVLKILSDKVTINNPGEE